MSLLMTITAECHCPQVLFTGHNVTSDSARARWLTSCGPSRDGTRPNVFGQPGTQERLAPVPLKELRRDQARARGWLRRPAAAPAGCRCPVPRGPAGWPDTRRRCPSGRCRSSVSSSSGRPWTWPSLRHMSARRCTVGKGAEETKRETLRESSNKGRQE